MEEKIKQRLEAVLQELKESLENGDFLVDWPEKNPVTGKYSKDLIIKEFKASPLAKLGFIPNEDVDFGLGIYLRIGLLEKEINAPDSEGIGILAEISYEMQWDFFKVLEQMIWTFITEFFNDDPCSFRYEYDTFHLGDKPWIEYRVYILDYLS